jgi:Trypsin
MNLPPRITAVSAFLAVAAGLAVFGARPAQALMAGASPDSPAARVDANLSSSKFAGVAAISINGGTYSGVVIAPQYILTAGHVAAAGPASAMQVILNKDSTPWTSTVVSATTYPSYNFPADDLAILQLPAPVPDGTPIYPMYNGTLRTGLTLVLAGYGASGNGNVGVSIGSANTVKRTGENALDQLTSQLSGGGPVSRFFLYDFDGPTGNGPLGGPTLGNAVETMVAVGDSGGPSFIQVGSSLEVLGINTFVAAPNGQTVTYTFGDYGGGIVAADPRFAAWLQSTTQGTLGESLGGDAGGPLPTWSFLVLGGALLVMGRWAGSRQAPRSGV